MVNHRSFPLETGVRGGWLRLRGRTSILLLEGVIGKYVSKQYWWHVEVSLGKILIPQTAPDVPPPSVHECCVIYCKLLWTKSSAKCSECKWSDFFF